MPQIAPMNRFSTPSLSTYWRAMNRTMACPTVKRLELCIRRPLMRLTRRRESDRVARGDGAVANHVLIDRNGERLGLFGCSLTDTHYVAKFTQETPGTISVHRV